mmetsp:Transcript_70534/g.131947  ORF Transcript_70534/g.131947 Transcript_70534/m.131947 type:complete len:362 (+) Transcript_70534:59-1144(+)
MGLRCLWLFAPFVPILSLLAAYVAKTGTERLSYRLHVSVDAFLALLRLSQEDVDAYVDSYKLFEQDAVRTEEDESRIRAYYRTIANLCALGPVEKMYIPPVYDVSRGVVGNQIMFEEKFSDLLEIGPGKTVLDLGCGRGQVAHHVASYTGAKVVGLNIDSNQIEKATEYANHTGMLGSQLEFKVGSFNDPLPFADQSFDGLYNIQAWTYVKDLPSFFLEAARVLKPGAKLSTLEFMALPNMDLTNATHQEIVFAAKALIGGVYVPTIKEYHDGLEAAGFEVLSSGEASATGHQFPLIEDAKNYFMPVGHIVRWLCKIGALPSKTTLLMDRLNKYAEEFIMADKLRLFTTSYHIVARKKAAA